MEVPGGRRHGEAQDEAAWDEHLRGRGELVRIEVPLVGEAG